MEFISFILAIVALVGMWKMFEKADEPGWAAIIPLYNVWVMLKIAGLNPLFILVMLIPLVNVIFGIYMSYKFVEAYGFGIGGFLLYLFFSPIMTIYMGFSEDVQYVGEKYEN
ncbi:signal peptidase I [Acidaminobacter sp. JC074]|uniref:DUF5684 domain-containing protein n=1 Tax=Acidaminobacter sp. JC074 TaxID=2530199 RepID=UPI001F0CF77A|nr:DUF5684 domain-containing protein [Acidaminobacter sp. JC074]MCH4886003.1 signal peptidase I [Acidaminobacter sp. JC074]